MKQPNMQMDSSRVASIDRLARLDRALTELMQAEVKRALSTEIFAGMLGGGIAGLASLANAKAVVEGRLLEKAIAVIATSNPLLKVLTQVRLPLRDAAIELVEQNDAAHYSRVTMDANERTRKSYTADLVIVEVAAQSAHIVDIKRSLGSFESARIVELRQRMLAAALVAPDLLWRDHKRLAVRQVHVVILEAAGKRTDLDGGIWSFEHLDHLVGVPGAASLVERLRANFSDLVELNLEAALDHLVTCRNSARQAPRTDAALGADVSAQGRGGREEPGARAPAESPRIGIAPPPPLH